VGQLILSVDNIGNLWQMDGSRIAERWWFA